MSFDPANGAFHLAYRPNHSVHAPTVIFAGSTYLELVNADRGHSVTVTVRRGSC